MRHRLLVIVPVLALALAGCASTPPAGTSPGAAAARPARSEAPGMNERALLALLADRRLFEALTVTRASDGPAALRRELAVTLGRVGDPQGRIDLELLLADREAPVRRAAAFALGELGDERARPALLAALVDADRETGSLAVEALGKLDVPLPGVLAALADLPPDERWARLLPHLFRFPPEARLPVAVEGLAAAAPALRGGAVYALARDPLPAAAPHLRPLLADPDPWLRALAARALGRVGSGADLERLEPLLADPEPGPLIQALAAGAARVAAGDAAAPDAWRPRLGELLADPRPQVRAAALAAAAEWLLDDALGARLAELATAGAAWERRAALVALARGGDPRAAELVAAAATDPEPAIRAGAAEAAGHLDPAAAEPLLERLRLDPLPPVRTAAVDAWTAVAGEPQAAAVIAETLASDTDSGVRAAAFGWLGEHPVLPAEALAQPTLWALSDRNVESSLNAVRALAARAAAEPLDRGAIIAVLERLAEKGDFTLRREASRALADLGRPPPPVGSVDTELGMEHYREIVLRTRQPRTVELHTSAGTLTLLLECPEAPLTCLNFLNLAVQGFYDGVTFHRVVPDFVVQGGDPRGDGWGGPGYTIRDEINRLRYRRGTVGMALAGADTGGSQFFITLSPQPHLDGGYTAFGRVVGGDEVLDRIVPGTVIESVSVVE